MIEAGANALVAGSAVFGAPDYSEGTNCISCVRALFLALLITMMPTHAQQCNAVAIVLDAEKWKALETPYIVLPMQYVWMACVLRFTAFVFHNIQTWRLLTVYQETGSE